ncbi:MAG: hypothetical protein QOD00_2983 [Blastocatellia bacterium]|jgi:hypothetical protein|nr:hypothetical protein [Blastocatellia bacterium]
MNDWIGLGLIVLIVVGGLYWLMRANQPHELTQEEYEKRLRESPGRGLVSGAAMGLQKVLDPSAEKAVAVLNDLRAGHYKEGQKSGDDDKDVAIEDEEAEREEGVEGKVQR